MRDALHPALHRTTGQRDPVPYLLLGEVSWWHGLWKQLAALSFEGHPAHTCPASPSPSSGTEFGSG